MLTTSSKWSFTCQNCSKKISNLAWGTKNRNHCPFCLYSLHADNVVGDRLSNCGGLMRPIGKVFKKDGEEVLVHKCVKCGEIRKNRVAGDDSLEASSKLALLGS